VRDVRACPYCAEQIQDAAIVCRFCGRDVRPVAESAPPKGRGLGVPSQRWYELDERVRTREPREQKRTIRSKLGGALDIFSPRELRAPVPGKQERLVRKYGSLRAYQAGVARMTQAGWTIERQDEDGDGERERFVVTWIRG
jgi:hypothetical protein